MAQRDASMNAPGLCRVFLVLPAYNEAAALPPLLEAIHRVFGEHTITGEVIVVDDGSRDGTRQIATRYADRLPLRVVEHRRNRGLGETLRDGLRAAATVCGPDDVVVTMDADNTHPPRLIPAMLAEIRDGADLVIASRYRQGARVRGLARHRQLLSIGARWLFRLVFPIPNVRDYTCGYRAYRGRLLHAAFARYGDGLVSERGFQCMAEILLKISRLTPSIRELPLDLRYDLKGGASKMRIIHTVLNTLQLLVRQRFAGH